MISWEALEKLEIKQRYPDKFYQHCVHYGLGYAAISGKPATTTLDSNVYKAIVYEIDPDGKKNVVHKCTTTDPAKAYLFFTLYNELLIIKFDL